MAIDRPVIGDTGRGTLCLNDTTAAGIDRHMSCITYNVSRLHIVDTDFLSDTTPSVRGQTSVIDTEIFENIIYKSTTVCPCIRICSAPYIRITDILIGKGYHGASADTRCIWRIQIAAAVGAAPCIASRISAGVSTASIIGAVGIVGQCRQLTLAFQFCLSGCQSLGIGKF